MKKSKIILLVTIIFIAIAGILVACNKSDENTNEFKRHSGISQIQSGADSMFVIGTISEGELLPMFDESDLMDSIVAEGILTSVSDVVIEYKEDPSGGFIAYFTVIGIDSGTDIAYQVRLIRDGNDLLLSLYEADWEFISKHECKGDPCPSCAFVREGGFLNLKIIGCKCNSSDTGNQCNHTVKGGGEVFLVIEKIVDLIF